MSEPRTPAQVLRDARQKDSRDKRARVLSVADQLVAENEPVTFTAERDDALARVKDLTGQLSELQDDLAAARASIRQLISHREHDQHPGLRRSRRASVS
ncbi:hypothetical protein ACJ6WF_42590 [Streptomyces sp. MMS24-I2-30]|uniref:hypothetical protein n=1 Tax=Streptomyces sp. MMS24-I2-30 TaxID=3351564 RepID=UPI0038969F5B